MYGLPLGPMHVPVMVVFMYACMHLVCMYGAYVYVCMCVGMFVCMSACMYVCMCAGLQNGRNLLFKIGLHLSFHVHVCAMYVCICM